MDATSIMKQTKSITATEFEGRCYELVEHVRRTRQPLVITRRGKPIAQLSPYATRQERGKKAMRVRPLNPQERGILYAGAPISPVDAEWDEMP